MVAPTRKLCKGKITEVPEIVTTPTSDDSEDEVPLSVLKEDIHPLSALIHDDDNGENNDKSDIDPVNDPADDDGNFNHSCEAEGCREEVFAACHRVFCQKMLCYDHFINECPFCLATLDVAPLDPETYAADGIPREDERLDSIGGKETKRQEMETKLWSSVQI